MAPGSAWTNRILRLAVAAPNTPATTTQPRKKVLTAVPSGPSSRPQARPAARKPLYRPWLAASAFEAAGYAPRLVRSDMANLKVTYPADLALAELILQGRHA